MKRFYRFEDMRIGAVLLIDGCYWEKIGEDVVKSTQDQSVRYVLPNELFGVNDPRFPNPIDPNLQVTYRQYGPTSWVAHVGRQAIDESHDKENLLERLRNRGCVDPIHKPFKICVIV